jgi:hypothetical protein
MEYGTPENKKNTNKLKSKKELEKKLKVGIIL